MKKMIRMMTMVAVMFVAVASIAKAQDAQQQGGRRGGRGANPVAILKDSLHVSDAVAAKADSIFKAYQTENAPLMQAARGGDQDAMQKSREARAKMTEAIKALLTDDQKAQFDKLMPGRRGGGAGR